MTKINWQDFLNTTPIKHEADIAIDDVLYLDNGDAFNVEEKVFERVVCDSYCGNDFMGFVEVSGQRVMWKRSVDMYKIIGKRVKTNQPYQLAC